MQQQLSLFNAPSGGGTVRPGDWVKLRRKTSSAPDWEKGEVVLVDSVHPDGSIRFWSDRTEEWAYLHPGDFALMPEPVTESIPPDDSVTPEPVTESIPLNDSVTKSVSRYRAKGTARGGEYFRFSYRQRSKIKHVHIPGGNTDSVLAQQRAAEVMELSAAGVPAVDICDRIRSWSGRITW
ncbi:hypothetical protein IQ269_19260 [Tychonema sp. LEGE 07199]|uniref:hypothetical protein n=1 Tax=unclassified Tychonema TaxID=2642144 RepID=UPI001881EB17|nr:MULTISPECIES: hypothetical protein [unclassified Tychonema]MBE9122877.1 hypothetical protein [Tychonema sp. LEGE 07199]MBE9134732.1 hypothetical protein [Tychonema sp. LEGE 07196]